MLQAEEAALLTALADILEKAAPAIEQDLGPVEIELVGEAIKVAAPIWEKLPFGIGALVDAALAKYSPVLEADLNQYVGEGLAKLVAFLRAAAAHLATA